MERLAAAEATMAELRVEIEALHVQLEQAVVLAKG